MLNKFNSVFMVALMLLVAPFIVMGLGAPSTGNAPGALAAAAVTGTPTPGVGPAKDPAVTPTPGMVYPPGIAPPTAADLKAVENNRKEILAVVKTLDELLNDLTTSNLLRGGFSHDMYLQTQKNILSLSPEEVYALYHAFPNFTTFKNNVHLLKTYQEQAKKAGQLETVAPGPDMLQAAEALRLATRAGKSKVEPDYFNVVPTATPNPAPILHDSLKDAEEKNNAAGDLKDVDLIPNPDYSGLGVTCRFGHERTPAGVGLAGLIAKNIAQTTTDVTDSLCLLLYVPCAIVGGGTNAPACLVHTIAKAVSAAADAVIGIYQGCDKKINYAELEATYKNTGIIHADLMDLGDLLTVRANNIDTNLFNFRNLNLRGHIEANLASPTDSPVGLFALPSSVCITGYSNPNSDALAPGCGLLEVVRDTVRSSIDMMKLQANQPVNNAEAEFAAAQQHYNQGQWKLAFDRFRKAYREVIRPTQ
ncbi:MAG: hypothetical protein EXR62_00080 [Chloroflexi bacterium]|nr:hypothetical protein [Chloroflexota bacterium]